MALTLIYRQMFHEALAIPFSDDEGDEDPTLPLSTPRDPAQSVDLVWGEYDEPMVNSLLRPTQKREKEIDELTAEKGPHVWGADPRQVAFSFMVLLLENYKLSFLGWLGSSTAILISMGRCATSRLPPTVRLSTSRGNPLDC